MLLDILSWNRWAQFTLISIQALTCLYLYCDHVSLVARINDLKAFQQQECFGDIHRRIERSVPSGEENELALVNATPATRETGRRHHRKNARGNVEKFFVSTEATTAAPVHRRESRVKMTGSRRKANQAEELSESGRRHNSYSPVAIHYNGQIANHSKVGNHRYHGNERMEVTGRYDHWTEAPWAKVLGTYKHFQLNNGKVIVEKTGLYLLYAQIYYSTKQEFNCFQARANGNVVAQCCFTSSHSSDEYKTNTCNMVTTVYLKAGDDVTLDEFHERRVVILTAEKSFFGLVQLIGE